MAVVEVRVAVRGLFRLELRLGGLGGMDMESMMKSMAGMAGVPDPPDLGADDAGADPDEAGSDLDDLPDLEEDNVD